VLPPPRRPKSKDDARELALWSGTPLDERNCRCFLETGTLVCLIGDPHCLEAVVTIEQQDVGLLQVGQQVRLKLDAAPQQVLEGEIAQVARDDAPQARREAGDELWRTALPAQAAPATTYRARVDLSSLPQGAVVGGRGQAKVIVAPQSLGNRLRRYLARTFRFSF
jgi:hypothetical protein